MPSILSPQRLVSVFVAITLLLLLSFAAFRHAEPIRTLKDTANSAAKHICSNDELIFPEEYSFGNSIFQLYEAIRHPITAKTYTDPSGRQFSVSENPTWTESLGKELLIVDIDTRIPTGENELWNPVTMNYEKLDATVGGQMVSAAFMNHFLYSQIHGYSYKFFAGHPLKDHHDTWIKSQVISDLLHSYKFVVFLDADATIQHLELPLEWLFNRWNITSRTSIAMPLDTAQVLGDNKNASCDSKGNLALNTGFIIAQNNPHTIDLTNAWRTCTTGTRYPDCGYWAQHWSHEQRAFSEYIRYDFNPDGDNIVEIECDDAMGFPGIVEENHHIVSNCTGQFVRHMTIGKSLTKINGKNAAMQSLAELMQKALLGNSGEFWEEGRGGKGYE